MIALWKCNIEANNIFNYESEIKDFISPEKEAKMRQHLMGHTSEKSGNVYNQRYIREKANKILLDLQIEFQKKVDNYESE